MDAGPHELASWGRRLAAVALDGLILAGAVLFAVALAGVSPSELNDLLVEGDTAVLLALFVLPEAFYETVMIGSRNQTLGKMAVGIKVVGADDRAPIGYARAFRRWLTTATLWALFTVPGIVDHLWPLRDRRNQTFHDKFARSVVVRA
ncbi:MAG TPA: RDD family protein [Gaiellaceae bacterium]